MIETEQILFSTPFDYFFLLQRHKQIRASSHAYIHAPFSLAPSHTLSLLLSSTHSFSRCPMQTTKEGLASLFARCAKASFRWLVQGSYAHTGPLEAKKNAHCAPGFSSQTYPCLCRSRLVIQGVVYILWRQKTQIAPFSTLRSICQRTLKG